jgi:hypothetical protein
MATKVFFAGKKRYLPGVYTTIISGIKNAPLALSYGNVLLIDTGSSAGYGGGSGISGQLASGQDAVYVLSNSDQYRSYFKGGLWWKLAEPLYSPAGIGSQGVSVVYAAKAATTTAAVITYTFGEADESYSYEVGDAGRGGLFEFYVKDEGLIGNGVLASTNLSVGYAGKMVAGSIDVNKFKIQFYRGTYKGLDSTSQPYDGVADTDAVPELLCESIEFDNVEDLINWARLDYYFNIYFKEKTFTTIGTGVVDSTDLTEESGYKLAVGGTETYSTTALDSILEAVKELGYSFVLCDNYGDDAQGVENGKILAHILTEARFEKMMIVGGGSDINKFNGTNGSIETAAYYDSDRVVVVHGGIKKKSQLSGTGFKEFDSIYKAAIVCGRLCNLPPQVPITFKSIDIDGELHSLTENERVLALESGVLVSHYDNDFGAFIVEQGVTTIQNNDNLINEDATTYSIQVRRIAMQLNKEIMINAKVQLLGDPNGVNKNTLSAKVLEDWVKGYLQTKTATTTQDNLITTFRDVVVTAVQDYYIVSYKFSPNWEITKLFITGVIVN